MKTGTQKYPSASTAYWYQSRYGGTPMQTNVIVWHSTEGTSLPSYGGGASAPNFTAKPDFKAKRLVWYQHFDFDVSSRALMNRAGGVDTNTLNVCQVEIVGTCDPATHRRWGTTPHLYTPELPEWAIRDLGAFARWASTAHGVPLTSSVTFRPYPSSYGSSPVRMSNAQWTRFRGHCGHQHVPENDHGDPGNMPITAILTAAKGGTTPPTEDDVPLTDTDLTKIADHVLKHDGVIKVPGASASNPTWTLSSVLTEVLTRLDKANASIAALTATNAKLVDTVAALAAGMDDLDPAAIVAELRAAIEGIEVRLDTTP